MLELNPPKGVGFIVRTAGADRTKRELSRDMAYLLRLWKVIARRIKKLPAPAGIYEESDMIIRTIRDIVTADVDAIYIDEPTAHERAKEFLQLVMPRYVHRLQMFEGKEPLFRKYLLDEEIAKIHRRRVPLKSGGSIVIDQTEALVAIDVNSGSFRAEGDAEESAYQMNLHAAKEIARQIRLRDLGGVIVNDFIDMRKEKHRHGIERALRDAMKRDRARTKILRTSPFGLIEMTRQRIRTNPKRSAYMECPSCGGSAVVKTPESMAIDVVRLLILASQREPIVKVTLRVSDEVADFLNNRKRHELARLEEEGEMAIQVIGVEGAAPEHLVDRMPRCGESGSEVSVGGIMAAYIVFTRESTKNAAELATYSEQVGGTLAGHPVTVLAAYGRQEVVEGPEVEGVVILKFPGFAEAKAWYDGPAYRKVREHRFRGQIIVR